MKRRCDADIWARRNHSVCWEKRMKWAKRLPRSSHLSCRTWLVLTRTGQNNAHLSNFRCSTSILTSIQISDTSIGDHELKTWKLSISLCGISPPEAMSCILKPECLVGAHALQSHPRRGAQPSHHERLSWNASPKPSQRRLEDARGIVDLLYTSRTEWKVLVVVLLMYSGYPGIESSVVLRPQKTRYQDSQSFSSHAERFGPPLSACRAPSLKLMLYHILCCAMGSQV